MNNLANQTQKGKAFEYSCLNALYNLLKDKQEIEIKDSQAFQTAKEFYRQLEIKEAENMDEAAKAAAKIIIRLEPQLEQANGNTPLHLAIQEDAKGIAGDVRDVVCYRNQNSWEIGLSCKHNHTAVKHSRLSYTIDFGAMWFGKACSNEYFNEIKPIFDKLLEDRQQKKKWNEIEDKENTVYVPLLNAFMNELKRLDSMYPDEIPSKLIRYLLGKHDFYKVITKDSKKTTTIQAYNLFGTLNKPAKESKSIYKVQQLKLPVKFYDISYKEGSNNTLIVTCDGGWALSFRIHNASTKVEPSLKFDVQLIGVPGALHSQIEPWDS